MTNEYFKQCLKGLDRKLKRVSRKARINAISAYETGLKFSFNQAYPDRFSFDKEDLSGVEEIFTGFYDFGAYVGQQFGPLEVESARAFLLARIEKRKTKFSKPSFSEKLHEILTDYYEFLGKSF